MNTRSQKIRLGIFVIFSALILASLVVFFSARNLFKKTDKYYVAYQDVSVGGLELGSPVKYLGIRMGSISDIRINPEDISSVILELSIRPGTPIKSDSKADIVSMGITGLKAIEIRGGTNEAPLLEPGEYIHPGSSLTDQITGRAEIIAEKAEMVLNNLQIFTEPENLAKITTLAENMNRLVNNADKAVILLDTLMENNRVAINATFGAVNEISASLAVSSKNLEKSIAQIRGYMQSDTLNQILGNARDISLTLKETDLGELIENLSRVAYQTHQILLKVDSDINMSSKELLESQHLLNLTLENLNEVSRKINNNPSILFRASRVKGLPDEQLNQ